MRHLFYVHSNICIISIFDTVVKLLEETNDEVVIIESRSCKWTYFLDSVKVVDSNSFCKGNPLNLRKVTFCSFFKEVFEYKKFLLSLKKNIEAFIGDKDFIIYLPTYNNELPDFFVKNPHCKGYYLIEEGSIDYLPLSFIRKISCNTKQAYFKRVLYPLLGTHFYFILHQGVKFKGCISLYEEAFPFIKADNGVVKIINGIDRYIREQGNIQYPHNIIVTGYLFEDEKLIRLYISKLLDELDKNETVAIKVHPEVYSCYPDKLRMIREIIAESGRDCLLLEPSFSIEAAIIKCKSNIYSLFTRSSLLLYALKNNAQACAVVSNGDSYQKEYFASVDDFINIFVSDFNYK